ncbi:MAG TPA: type II toxin-antitoxin system RelE/ParE family toxin [Terracidiphilus sp.]|nr:type II toxin-antitoxin system RelE/ParE family toxin [Terracidiphilus sp.]
MSVDLVWTPQAREDLIEIYIFIGDDNPSAAERVFDAVREKVELLTEHPRLGVRRREISPSTRILIEGPYLILYETHPDSDKGKIDEVEIVRIVDGRRNLKILF